MKKKFSAPWAHRVYRTYSAYRNTRHLSRRTFLRMAGSAGVLGLGAATGCSLDETLQKNVIRGTTMGTYYAITYLHDGKNPSVEDVRKKIEERFSAINQQMSTYIPDSELSRFNQFRDVNTPFPVSSNVITVVREAIRLHAVTAGKLDVTVGPLVNLWGFGPDGRANRVPTDAEIRRAKAQCGINNLDIVGDALVKKIPDLYVDLSSIAKGFGVEYIADELEALGIDRYLVDVGGEVRGLGASAHGGPWRVAVERPISQEDTFLDRMVHLADSSVATSGDYRNYFEKDGHRYSHTIDPSIGRPITHNLASVTVMHHSCMTADGLATGLDVLGPDKGMEQAIKMDIACTMIVKEGGTFHEKMSPAWRRQTE